MFQWTPEDLPHGKRTKRSVGNARIKLPLKAKAVWSAKKKQAKNKKGNHVTGALSSERKRKRIDNDCDLKLSKRRRRIIN
jgi:hypothetical protein